jgi:hypothetical protein
MDKGSVCVVVRRGDKYVLVGTQEYRASDVRKGSVAGSRGEKK